MPSLQKSIPPSRVPPLPLPSLGVSPPSIRPRDFEDFTAFRETFLVFFSREADNQTVRAFGNLLYEMVLETWGNWPKHPEGIFTAQLRAVLADLRHLQGALSAWCEPGVTARTKRELKLARTGSVIAQSLTSLANRLERDLPGGGAPS